MEKLRRDRRCGTLLRRHVRGWTAWHLGGEGGVHEGRASQRHTYRTVHGAVLRRILIQETQAQCALCRGQRRGRRSAVHMITHATVGWLSGERD
jgi:hypothetical protein